jgi:hypothetical protein
VNLEDRWEKNVLGRYGQARALEFFSMPQIMAITGHTTSRMVTRNTGDADQHTRASAAILKLERNGK